MADGKLASFRISGAFMKFSWDFRGSESLRSKHLLTLGQFPGTFVDPLQL